MSDKRKKYRKYDREFKINAAKLVNEQGMTQTKVSQDLGVSLSLIGKWARQFAADRSHSFPGQGRMKPLEEEVARLRQELKRSQMQVEILRKATAYFAQIDK
jgi:transposase